MIFSTKVDRGFWIVNFIGLFITRRNNVTISLVQTESANWILEMPIECYLQRVKKRFV
jgi:hypothetical protein